MSAMGSMKRASCSVDAAHPVDRDLLDEQLVVHELVAVGVLDVVDHPLRHHIVSHGAMLSARHQRCHAVAVVPHRSDDPDTVWMPAPAAMAIRRRRCPTIPT